MSEYIQCFWHTTHVRYLFQNFEIHRPQSKCVPQKIPMTPDRTNHAHTHINTATTSDRCFKSVSCVHCLLAASPSLRRVRTFMQHMPAYRRTERGLRMHFARTATAAARRRCKVHFDAHARLRCIVLLYTLICYAMLAVRWLHSCAGHKIFKIRITAHLFVPARAREIRVRSYECS